MGTTNEGRRENRWGRRLAAKENNPNSGRQRTKSARSDDGGGYLGGGRHSESKPGPRQKSAISITDGNNGSFVVARPIAAHRAGFPGIVGVPLLITNYTPISQFPSATTLNAVAWLSTLGRHATPLSEG